MSSYINKKNKVFKLHKSGRLQDAEQLYQQLLKTRPSDPEIQHGLAAIYHQTGRAIQALPLLEQVLVKAPNSLTTLLLYARISADQGQQATAIEALNRYLELRPGDSAFINFRAQLLYQMGKHGEALADFSLAARQCPDNNSLQHDLGVCLSTLGRLNDAVDAFRAAIKLDPRHANSHYHLAQTLKRLGQQEAYYQALKKADSLAPGNLSVAYETLIAARHACDWTDLVLLTQRLEEALRKHLSQKGEEIIPPGPLNHLDVDAELKSRVAARYAEQICDNLERPPDSCTTVDSISSSKRICIGYLSTDLNNHAVGTLIYRLFEQHDRDSFRINAYALRHKIDPFQKTIAKHCDSYKDISSLSEEEAARLIKQDGVDILIDMTGYTGAARPLISARKPAPLIVSYLGYQDTMGASWIDYIIADTIVIPVAQEPHYREKIIRLPVFMVTSRIDQNSDHPARSDYGLPENRFVFCSFNQSYKLEPESFACWMEILKQVEDSILWIYASNRTDAQSNLIQMTKKHGVDPDRLVWVGIKPLGENIQRMGLADLYLDTFQVSGGATLVSALMGGLPVLSLAGDTYLSRMGTSMNNCLHMQELDCTTPDEYVQRAVELANSEQKMHSLKTRLQQQLQTNRLFDTGQFARSLEAAYRRIWERHLSAREPANIDINDQASGASTRPDQKP